MPFAAALLGVFSQRQETLELLVSYLRPSKIDGAKHAWAILALLAKRLRQAWPQVKIIFRADSGFCRWRMLSWCERHDVGYIVGIAKNKRLNALQICAVFPTPPFQHFCKLDS